MDNRKIDNKIIRQIKKKRQKRKRKEKDETEDK